MVLVCKVKVFLVKKVILNNYHHVLKPKFNWNLGWRQISYLWLYKIILMYLYFKFGKYYLMCNFTFSGGKLFFFLGFIWRLSDGGESKSRKCKKNYGCFLINWWFNIWVYSPLSGWFKGRWIIKNIIVFLWILILLLSFVISRNILLPLG